MSTEKPTSELASEDQQGLVISYFGSMVAVEAEDGQIIQCHLHKNQILPVVGDKVVWRLEKGNSGTVQTILPRKSQLSRGDAQGKSKAIAANIDAIVVVTSPPPIFSEYFIDRYLVAAELLSIPPIIVLNKIDLLEDAALAAINQRLEPYREIPYPVVLTSIFLKDGLRTLAAELKGKTAVLVGTSGVGKSSIISALGNDEVIRVGDVSPKGIGKHTTTATRLYHLPEGGNLIDSPGVREFNLWPVTGAEVLRGFKDLKPYLSGCKFRDCQHVVEPGCAVQEAVKNGNIRPLRYANFQQLMKKAAPIKKY